MGDIWASGSACGQCISAAYSSTTVEINLCIGVHYQVACKTGVTEAVAVFEHKTASRCRLASSTVKQSPNDPICLWNINGGVEE